MAGFSSPYLNYSTSPAPPGYGMPPTNPGAFQQPVGGVSQQTSPFKVGSSGLSSYAQPPVFQPSSMMQAPQYQQFNMGGSLSDNTGGGQQSGNDTPWYKNPAILNTIAGAGGAILQSHNESAQRAQEQQRIDLQKQSYDDQHKRAQATSDAINPIIARLLGQMMQPQQRPS